MDYERANDIRLEYEEILENIDYLKQNIKSLKDYEDFNNWVDEYGYKFYIEKANKNEENFDENMFLYIVSLAKDNLETEANKKLEIIQDYFYNY